MQVCFVDQYWMIVVDMFHWQKQLYLWCDMANIGCQYHSSNEIRILISQQPGGFGLVGLVVLV